MVPQAQRRYPPPFLPRASRQIKEDCFISDEQLRTAVFVVVPRDMLIQTLQGIGELVRPADQVFYQELQKQRRFLPVFLQHIPLAAVPAGADLLEALEHLRYPPPTTRTLLCEIFRVARKESARKSLYLERWSSSPPQAVSEPVLSKPQLFHEAIVNVNRVNGTRVASTFVLPCGHRLG
jgi:hypothetical protein